MENLGGKQARILTATQIPVLPFLLLIVCVLVVNPILHRIRIIRRLSTAEVMLVFVMTMVSSGISTFGLASQLVPAIAGLFNPSWNTAQARWDRHVEPFISETYFLSESGIQEQAAAARAAEDAWRAVDTVLRTARALDDARRAAERLEVNLADASVGAAARVQLTRQLALEQDRITESQARWARHVRDGSPDIGEVLRAYPERAAGLLAEYEAKRAALADLEKTAFAKVELFRKGLPSHIRAVPGIIRGGDEAWPVYISRLHRMRAGMAAAGRIDVARRALRDGHAAEARTALRDAIDWLEPFSDRASLDKSRAALIAERERIEPLLTAARAEIQDLKSERRMLDATEFAEMDARIESAESTAKRIESEVAEIAAEISAIVDPRIRLAEEIGAVHTALGDIDSKWDQGAAPAAMDPDLAKAASDLEQLNISWRAMLVGGVPWREWLRPLARWAILIVAAYAMLMTLNVLIFRQWAHHEKLCYPLADLPLALAGAGDEDSAAADSSVPAIYRTGVFWIGFAISAFTMGWNILAARQIIPGIRSIAIRWPWSDYVTGSIFSGLNGGSHQVFFTAIGLSFLIPARISKSLWGFHVIYMGLLLALVSMGHGVDASSFPANMTMVLNFRNAIGGGALIAFSSMVLWTCRKYMLCAAFPGAVAGLEPAERRELRIASAVFLLSSATMIGLLSFGMGANIWFTTFCYLVIVLITIGMIRGVAEGGLLVFQCHFSPFHILRSTFGMNRPWTSVTLFAPLVAFYYVMFWDLKTFIAPAMANVLKVRDSLGLQRIRFHAAVWLGIGIAAGVSIATHIILSYEHGANTMHPWFYSGGPQGVFQNITDMAVSNPIDESGGGYWMLAGILVTAGLLWIRRRRFGWLHPIGLVMWVYPNMWAVWFSIFLGWLFKSLVSRYGDRSTYQKFRIFFIGLIAGELLMCLFGIDLNRY